MALRSLGTLTLDLVARTGGFVSGMSKAERQSARWRRQVEADLRVVQGRINTVLAAGAAATAAATATLTALTKRGIDAVNSQAALAQSLNTTYDSITALKLAAGDTGLEGLEGSITRLNRRLGAAEVGSGAAANAVKALRLDLQALSAMDVDERVATIADAIRDSGVSAQRAARFAQDLGFEQQQAAEFFLQGGDAIRAYRTEVDALGLSLSDVDAAQVQEAVNAMVIFSDLSSGVAQRLAVELSPILRQIASEIEEAAIEVGGFGGAISEAVDSAVVRGIRLAATYRGAFNLITDSVNSIWQGFQSLPPWAQEVGIAGAIIGGKKGVLLVAAISGAAEEMKTTAAWFAAYTQGDIGFAEWLTTGNQEAKERLRELGHDVDALQERATGPSLIQSLFGGADDDEWADDLIARYRRIRDESEQIAREAAVRRRQIGGAAPGDDDAEALKRREKFLKEYDALLRGLRTEEERALDTYIEKMNTLNQAVAEGITIVGGYEQARQRIGEEYERTLDELKRTTDSMSVYAEQAARNMQTVFADFLFDPFDEGLEGMLKGFLRVIQRIAAEAAAAQIFDAIGGWGQSSNVGWVQTLAGAFAGSRATGGPTAPGSLYRVNERGPELYTERGQTYLMSGADGGFVTPLASGAGGAPINVVVNIDSGGLAGVTSDATGLEQFGSELGRFVEQKYRQLVARDLSDGGQIKRAMSGGYR